MMTNEVAPEVIEKVSRQFAKLMEKAKSTDSEGEAENCVALANKLLWDANLEETQLYSLDDLEHRSKRTFIKDGVHIGPSRPAINRAFDSRDWKSELLEVLAQNFFCKTHDGYAEQVTIVGEPQNVEIVKGLYAYLEKQIRASRRLAFNLAKQNNEIEFANQQSRTRDKARALSQFAVHSFKNSFSKGAVAALARRLDAQQKANVEEADRTHTGPDRLAISFGAALVAQMYSELDEAFYAHFPHLHPREVKLREYKAQIAYTARMAELEAERVARETRIAAGEELPEEPVKPSKRRGRKRLYRNTLDSTAYVQGNAAGNTIQINPALQKGGPSRLNK